MPNSRAAHRIEVVLFDAMYCLFEAKESRAKQLARVFSEEAGIDDKPRRIWEVTQRIRNSLPPSSDYRRDWALFNRRIIAELTGVAPESVSVEVAERIQRRILWDATLYEVKEDVCDLLRELHDSSVKLGIASNQDRAALDNMMRTFGVADFFSLECIFTSDRIAGAGEAVSKPHLEFWRLVQEKLGASSRPEFVPFVGNSLRNDMPAVRSGHPVILFDRCGHQQALLPDIPQLCLCRSPKDILRVLREIGLP